MEISAIYEALDNMDDYALMAGVKPTGPHKVLTDAIAELEQLRQRVQELEKEVAHWKNNHETEVRRARILKERTDMPIERVQAYEQWGKDMAERDKATQYWQIAEGRCDALKQQRDGLLKACETYMSHGICDVTYYAIRNAIATVKEK